MAPGARTAWALVLGQAKRMGMGSHSKKRFAGRLCVHVGEIERVLLCMRPNATQCDLRRWHCHKQQCKRLLMYPSYEMQFNKSELVGRHVAAALQGRIYHSTVEYVCCCARYSLLHMTSGASLHAETESEMPCAGNCFFFRLRF